MYREFKTVYHPMLHGFGLPYKLNGTANFDLQQNLISYNISEDRIKDTRKQRKSFDVACKEAPGWLMYVCANGVIDKARHVAANIMQAYFERELKVRWLTSFDNVKDVAFRDLKLVIVDALFFDSNSFRRDKIYELINHNCNVPDLSVLVLGQHSDPLAMANQLGMKPNMAILTK